MVVKALEPRFCEAGHEPDQSLDRCDAQSAWRAAVDQATRRLPLREPRFATLSGVEVPMLAKPANTQGEYAEKLGFPGQYPFTRGVQPTGYLGKLWTMRQFAGFGS